MLISGEPGIGKSRIVQSFIERLAAEPHTRLRYFCSPHHQDTALYPMITPARAGGRVFGATIRPGTAGQAGDGTCTSDERFKRGRAIDRGIAVDPDRDRYPPLNLTPQKRKEKTLEALVAQVEGLAARQPVLMVIEDVHWSDPTSLELLDLTIDRVATMPVLLIISFRPEFAPPWMGRPHVILLSLNRLPPPQRAEMIIRVTSGKRLPKEITDQIIDRTDGVPLFIEELTKSVVEGGLVTVAGDRYAVTGPAAALAIPTTLHDSLLARLDRLAPTREVAQIAAALGRSFSHVLISAVAQMPRIKLDDALEQLVRAELIFRRGIAPDAEYTFKHALVQDAAYSTLLRTRRQQIHARIVATLESQFSEIAATQPALLAQHCAEASLTAKAVAYRLKAGQQALARSAMMEASAQLHKGLDLLTGLSDGPDRQQFELDLQLLLGMTLTATEGYAAPVVAKAFARARQLCQQLDRPSQLAMLLVGQASYHFIAGELALACQESKELVDLGEDRNDADVKFQGCTFSAITWFHVGDFVATRDHAERAMALFDPPHPSEAWWTQNPYVTALTFSFRSLTYLGYLDQARARREEALAQAHQRQHALTLAMVRCISLLTLDHIRIRPRNLIATGRGDEGTLRGTRFPLLGGGGLDNSWPQPVGAGSH